MFSYDISGDPLSIGQDAVGDAEPDVATLQGRERRRSERVIAYWEKTMTRHGGGATIATLDLSRMRSSDWSHRFVIAVDPLPENSALLYYGGRFRPAGGAPRPADFAPRRGNFVVTAFPASSPASPAIGHAIRIASALAANAPIVSQLPERFSGVFVHGCGSSPSPRDARSSGGRDRTRGWSPRTVPRRFHSRRRQRKRARPVAFGVYTSRIFAPALAA